MKRFEFFLLQGGGKKLNCGLPRVGGIFGTITIFVDGVFEAVSGIGVNGDVDTLTEFLKTALEFGNARRNALIMSAKQSEHRGVTLFQGLRVGYQVTVVDNDCAQSRLLKGNIQRKPSAHTPTDGANAVFFHVRL